MRVYRIGCPCSAQHGPYNAHRCCKPMCADSERPSWVENHTNTEGGYPTPVTEGFYGMSETCRCGFDSMDKLKEWFAQSLDLIEPSGYQAVSYEAPGVVWKGDKQLVFSILDAHDRRVEKLNATHEGVEVG